MVRESKSITEIQLARSAQIPANVIARLEAQEMAATFVTARKLAAVLGVDVEELTEYGPGNG